MTVPNVPYWLQPIHTEFETSGAISNAGRAAKLPSQFWCSQFAGKSSLPKRLFHGVCNAMNDGNYTMQDLSIWGPGYTYVVEVTACKDKIACQMLTFVVNWNLDGTLDYHGDITRALGVTTAYNFYMALQYENDGDTNHVWISFRDANAFGFRMEEGRTNNDGNMDCCIDVWAYKYGSHPVNTLSQTTEAHRAKATAIIMNDLYLGATQAMLTPQQMSWVYGRSTNFSKYAKSYDVVLGKKYLATLSYTNIVINAGGIPAPVKEVLGQSIIRVMNNVDFVQPWNGSYDSGGPGLYLIIQYGGGYGGSGAFGESGPFYILVPPRSYAAGTVTQLLSTFDIELVEIP